MTNFQSFIKRLRDIQDMKWIYTNWHMKFRVWLSILHNNNKMLQQEKDLNKMSYYHQQKIYFWTWFIRRERQEIKTKSNQGRHRGICNNTDIFLQVTNICDAYGRCYVCEQNRIPDKFRNKNKIYDSQTYTKPDIRSA